MALPLSALIIPAAMGVKAALDTKSDGKGKRKRTTMTADERSRVARDESFGITRRDNEVK